MLFSTRSEKSSNKENDWGNQFSCEVVASRQWRERVKLKKIHG
jgi:hypothetical protein